MFNTPIAFFIFNRPDTTAASFASIAQIKPARLFIIADGPRLNNDSDNLLCQKTRETVENIDWDCHVERLYSTTNIGCRNSIANGLNYVFNQVEECIIIEDDCLPLPSFYLYCSDLLDKYRNDETVMTIGGYRNDGPNEYEGDSYYFSKYPVTWGWATWKNCWEKVDLELSKWSELKNTDWLKDILHDQPAINYWSRIFNQMQNDLNTWDYALTFACWINKGFSIRSSVNMINYIGYGSNATHTFIEQPSSEFSLASNIALPLKHPKEKKIDNETEKRIEWVTFSGMDIRLMEQAKLKISQKRKQSK
jgi:hypothetical protein